MIRTRKFPGGAVIRSILTCSSVRARRVLMAALGLSFMLGPLPQLLACPEDKTCRRVPIFDDCGSRTGTRLECSTSSPIRFATGAMELATEDLKPLRGQWLGHTRRYNNKIPAGYDGPNGYNWVVFQMPYAELDTNGTSVAIVLDANEPVFFDKVGGSYVPRHGQDNLSLSHDGVADEFTFLAEDTGDLHEMVFHDFTVSGTAGKLKSYTDPTGTTTTATYSSGLLAELQQSYTDGGTTTLESLLYTHVVGGTNANKIETITQRRKVGAGNWVDLRRASYAYHTGSDAHGNAHDLKSATIQEPDGSGGWDDVAVSYYRYYKTGSNFVHGLKYALDPEGYRRMVNDSLNPLTATDGQLADYAEHYFEYDASKRVTREVASAGCSSCSGGSAGTAGDTFVYAASAHSNLTWIKDERGFMTRQVYDATKGVMIQLIRDVDTTQTSDEPSGWSTPGGGGLHAVTDYEYDDEGRLVQVLGPSHEAIVGGTPSTVRTANWYVPTSSVKPASGTWGPDEVWTGQGYATGTSLRHV